MKIWWLALAGGVSGVIVLARLVYRWLPDRQIDALIAQNKAKFCDGMERTHWPTVERAGQRKWTTVLRAQRRLTDGGERDQFLRRVR